MPGGRLSMKFAEKVKHVRAKLYISQQALAKAVGVSFQTVNRWENSHCEPNLIQEAKFNDFCEKNGIKFVD